MNYKAPVISLVPTTQEIIRSGRRSNESLQKTLKIQVPKEWPPNEVFNLDYDSLYDCIEIQLGLVNEPPWGTWLIVLHDVDPTLVGYLNIMKLGIKAELAIELLTNYTRRGIGRETFKIAINMAFNVNEIQYLDTTCIDWDALQFVMSLGFRQVDDLPMAQLIREDWNESYKDCN